MNRREAITAAAATGIGAVALVGPASRTGAQAGVSRSTSTFVTTADGTQLFARDWGSGKPVLFLSGWTLPSDFWNYQMLAAVRNGFRAISYDRRGHGRSSDPGRGYDHDTLADDLAAVIAASGANDVTVVAHSMGATELARYATRHSGKGIAKAILVGTITPFLMKSNDNPAGVPQTALAALRAPLERDFPAWIEANTPPFFTAETSPQLMAWGKQLMLQTSLLAATNLAAANAETDFRSDVRAMRMPLLLVHGDKDISAPLALTAHATASLARDARLVVYEGAPHGLPLTHAERLNADIASFVGGA